MKSALVVCLAAAAAWGQSVSSGSVTVRGNAQWRGGSTVTGDFFLAPNGDDGNPCSVTLPCLTPQHASAVVRGMPGGKHIVTLRGGRYPLSATWTLNAGDSGASGTPIVYQSYPGEMPVLSGGRQITGTWTADSGTNCGTNCQTYYLDLDADPSHSGRYQNFESLFYNGVRRARPQARSTVGGYLTNACPGTNTAPMCVAGANQAAADTACGCPSGSGTCTFQSSPCSGSTPWMCFNKFQYGGSDLTGTWHGIALGDIELLAFEKWSMGRARLATASSGAATFTGPLGLSNGNSGCLPGYSYLVENVKENAQAGQWYLDRCPGCASTVATPATTWRLYIFADTTIGENPASDSVLVPGLDPTGPLLLTASGLQYVTFQGLTFQHDNWIPGPYGLGDSQGMPLVPAAVSFTNSNNITLNGLTLGQVQGWGVEFLGASANNQVINSALYDVGAGGIRIGKQATQSDTDSNVPSNNTVQNTAVAYFGRIQPTGEATGILLGDTHGNLVTHNDVFGGYTGCINLGFGLKRGADDGSTTTQFFAYNNTVSWNHCYGQGQNNLFNGLLSDFGGIYAASSLSANCPTTGQPALSPTNTYCNHITFNRVHDLAHNYEDTNDQGAQGIYLDQGTSNVEVRSNLVYRISHTCAFNNTPQHVGPNQFLSQWNLWDNNIFAYCGAQQSNLERVVSRGGDNGNSLTWSHNISYYNSSVDAFPQSSPGHWGCFADDGTTAAACTTRFAFQNNDWWNAGAGNALAFATCQNASCSGFPTNYNLFSAMPWSGEDSGSVNVDPQFINPVYGVDDWRTQADLSAISFQSWDYTQAGRSNPLIAVPVNIPDLFPQRAIDANNDYYGAVALLPQRWVDQHQCDAALNSPDVTRTVKSSGGDYAGTQAGLQQALNDAEALRVSMGQSTKIVVDTDVTITISGQANSLTMPNNGYGGSKCVAIVSASPLRRTTQVGTVAIQSLARSSGTVTVTTLDPHGLSTGDTALIENVTGWTKNFNGTFAVTVTNSTTFTYSQTGATESGTVTFPFTRVLGPNTLAQQVPAKFYHVIVSGNNAAAIQGAGGSHHWAWFDADITTVAATNDTPLVLLGNASDDTGGYAGQGFHMGIDQFYIHGCAGSVPTTIAVFPQPVPCATETKLKNAIRWLCGDCWVMNGMTDQIVYQGVESHAAGTYAGQGPAKMVNNHFRSGSTTVHFGGSQPTITGLVPSDVEIRLNTMEIDPNWFGLSNCGLTGGSGRQWALKNRIEIKNGTRFLVAGNRVNYSWCDGQVGSLMLLTVRGDGYWDQSSHVTLEDNLFQHGHDWLQLTGRDDSNVGQGLSMHGSNYLIRNNLVTDIASLTWAVSAGSSKAVPLGGNGQTYTCGASRTANIATLSNCVCTSAASCPYTGITAGDYIHTSACSDASFNSSRRVKALSAVPFTAGPITFSDVGPDATGVSCTLSNMQGWPQYVQVDHNTIIADNEGSSIRNLLATTAVSGSDPDLNVARNVTYKNTIMAKTGGGPNWFYCAANSKEGTSSSKAAGCVDMPTFAFHHLALFGPGGASGNYSEWAKAGQETTTLATVKLWSSAVCSGTPDQSCAGFVNNFSTTADSDYHNYGLLSGSYYKSGQPGQADDGKDLGVDLNELDGALVQGKYVCRTPCGTGPYAQ